MVILGGIKLDVIIGELDTRNQEMVLLIWCMSTKDEPVYGVVFVGWPVVE